MAYGDSTFPYEPLGWITLYAVFDDSQGNRFLPDGLTVNPTITDSWEEPVSVSIVTEMVAGPKVKISFNSSGLEPGRYQLHLTASHVGVEYPIVGDFELTYVDGRMQLITMLREMVYDSRPDLYRFEVFDEKKHAWNLTQMAQALSYSLGIINRMPWLTSWRLVMDDGRFGFPEDYEGVIIQGAIVRLFQTRIPLEILNTLQDAEAGFVINRAGSYEVAAAQERAQWKEDIMVMKRSEYFTVMGRRGSKIPYYWQRRTLGLRFGLSDIFSISGRASYGTWWSSVF